MPSIYRRPGWQRFWYIPVAALVSALVALGVVFAGERYLFDDDDAPPAAGVPDASPTPGGSPAPGGDPTADATETEGTPAETPEGTPTAQDGLPEGEEVIIAGTGDECLNIRAEPGLGSDVIDCLPDGTELVIVGGPVNADDLRWLEIDNGQYVGWAADEYLEPR